MTRISIKKIAFLVTLMCLGASQIKAQDTLSTKQLIQALNMSYENLEMRTGKYDEHLRGLIKELCLELLDSDSMSYPGNHFISIVYYHESLELDGKLDSVSVKKQLLLLNQSHKHLMRSAEVYDKYISE